MSGIRCVKSRIMYHVNFVFIDEIQCIIVNCLRVGAEAIKYVLKLLWFRGSAIFCHEHFYVHYPLSYGVPVRERYGSTLLPATREQHDQNCTQSH